MKKTFKTYKGRKLKPKVESDELVRNADTRRIFSKGDTTNWSCEMNSIIESIHVTNPT